MSVDNACAVRGERRVMKQLVCGLARPAHPGLSPGNLNLRLTYKMEAYWAATSIFIEIIYLWRRSPGGCRCVPDSSPEIDQRHIVMCAFSAYLYKYFAFYLPCIIIISVIYGRTFTHMAPHPAALLSLWQNFRPAAPPAVPHPPPPRLYFSNHLSDFVLHHLHLVSQLVGNFLRKVLMGVEIMPHNCREHPNTKSALGHKMYIVYSILWTVLTNGKILPVWQFKKPKVLYLFNFEFV